MTLTVDLQNQGQVDYFMTFFIFGCIYDIDLDLRVDFIVFDAKDLAFIKICHSTSKNDLENQGQRYFL